MSKLKSSTSFTSAAAAVLLSFASPVFAQNMELTGTPALTGMTSQVTGILSVEEIGPLDRSLGLTMADAATGEPLTDFDVELTQELHVIGTDTSFSTFIHEHAEAAGSDGRLEVDVSFPKPGLYHIYTDAVPTGLGQQVLRFDLEVGVAQEAGSILPEPQSGDILTSSAGPYEVQLDVSDLHAGGESAVMLEILKDGQPAEDLAPYLDVPAHAVFIATENLAYIHAHATAAGKAHTSGEHGGHAGYGEAEGTAEAAHAGHGSETKSHEGHDEHAPDAAAQTHAAAGQGAEARGHGGHGTAPADEPIPTSLQLYVTPPEPGIYALWIQFMGGGDVRTAPFMISVQ